MRRRRNWIFKAKLTKQCTVDHAMSNESKGSYSIRKAKKNQAESVYACFRPDSHFAALLSRERLTMASIGSQ